MTEISQTTYIYIMLKFAAGGPPIKSQSFPYTNQKRTPLFIVYIYISLYTAQTIYMCVAGFFCGRCKNSADIMLITFHQRLFITFLNWFLNTALTVFLLSISFSVSTSAPGLAVGTTATEPSSQNLGTTAPFDRENLGKAVLVWGFPCFPVENL